MTFELRLGSCLDPSTGLASLADKSVDVTITDPPYEAEAHEKGRRTKVAGWRQAAARGEAAGVAQEAPLAFTAITEQERTQSAAEFARVTRRWILVFCQVEAAMLWRAALETVGVEYIRTMVWTKPNAQPQFTGDRPGHGYESIVVAHARGKKRWNGGGRLGVFDHCTVAAAHESVPHQTAKPLPLMRELVSLFTDPGDIVLDAFAGSGTTGVACNQLGRRFIGWELSPEYHAIATRRLNGDEAKPRPEQPSLFDALESR